MKLWERHGPVELPFHVLAKSVRRCVESVRLVYWRHVLGFKIGRGVRVHWSVMIPPRVRVSLSDDVQIGAGVKVHSETPGGALTLGEGTSIDIGCELDASGDLRIGRNVTLSAGAAVYTHSHGRDPRSAPRPYSMIIEDDVWLCAHAMVLSSARTIGAKAVIGPYVVVREPVPDGVTLRTAEPLGLAVRDAVPRGREGG